MIAGVAANQNPFPGLRPFREDEEHFFFGRESQVDAMVNKLSATCFLAVVGTSGCGKSSLINCGLRPALHRGLMASAGPAWRIAKFRPDVNPIRSLAKALATEGVLYSGYKEDMPIEEIIETYLHRSRQGVVETFRKARLPEGTNLLIVADQFEELFRYGKLGTQDGKDSYTMSENAIAFVNLLLEARFKPGCPIYVVITMRSDFLGDCSQFYGLPEAINEGQYLVPRMTRDERRASIEGPVKVGGAEISPVLITRLLNDVGDNPDQLSILQHALNRTWACWESHGAEGELKLEHYIEIGTMGEALNHHADEAFEQLEIPERAKICEKLFKALTNLGTDRRGTRRPLELVKLREIVGTGSEDEVKAVIEVFREPSRSFLMPPVTEPLEPEKVIDISHESLMRIWERLRRWADDEANSARRYRLLAETAAQEKAGKAGLWRDPELQLALDWQEEQTPTPAWASLYGGDFECTIAFLEKSRSERDRERAEAMFERRWKRRRLLIILLIAGIFLWRLIGVPLLWKHFPGDLQWLLNKVGYRPYATEPGLAQTAAPSRLPKGQPQGPDQVYHLRFSLALAWDLGLYLLGYFALAYFGKRAFRRLAFAKILHNVALSSSKAVREQKLAEQALALTDPFPTLQMTYASFWRRLGAYVLALCLFTVGLGIFIVGLVCAADFLDRLGSASVGVLLIPFVVGWLYQAMMLSSRRRATLGMLALGIFVTNQNGSRLNFGRATARYFAKILSYITLGIGFFIQPFTRKGQTLHDLIVRSVVLVRPDKKRVKRWIVVLCVIIGCIVASLPFIGGLAASRQTDAYVGLRYQYGLGVPKDLGKAAELYQKAADKGNAMAQANLGWLYESGQGVPKDLRKAAEFYQKAADQGNAPAQTNLAWLYQYGEGVPKDLAKAAELFKKAAELYQKAADQGYASPQAGVGWLYESGQGLPKDLSKAAEFYQKAADQGNADAQTNLAWLYQYGQGVPKDLPKAGELLSKAAELHQKAADQGDADAQDSLGWLYQNGQGVPKDLAKAADLYQKAADQGNAPAQRHLGWLYENGQGVPKDLAKAADLYQKAADQGDYAALGWLYENGRGVPEDLAKAAELYQRAADRGSTFAQNNLGWLYENGRGVPKDLAKAADLYQKAANHGYQPAIANLKRLSGH